MQDVRFENFEYERDIDWKSKIILQDGLFWFVLTISTLYTCRYGSEVINKEFKLEDITIVFEVSWRLTNGDPCSLHMHYYKENKDLDC